MRCRVLSFWVVLAVVALVSPAWGLELVGRVVAVADGDTLTLLDSAKQQYRIRLAWIDAPEKGQPFGQRSKESLSEMCYGEDATVKVVDIDQYGRVVGRVFCKGVDVNFEQVRRGMAWVYTEYNRDRGLKKGEKEAKESGRGLWSQAEPVPPWEWRKRKGG